MPAVRTPTAPGDLTPVPQGFSTRRPLETTLGNWKCLHGLPPRTPQWLRPNANALSAWESFSSWPWNRLSCVGTVCTHALWTIHLCIIWCIGVHTCECRVENRCYSSGVWPPCFFLGGGGGVELYILTSLRIPHSVSISITTTPSSPTPTVPVPAPPLPPQIHDFSLASLL